MSGGPAVLLNVNTDGEVREDNGFMYLYFLPETTFTGGKQYLGGIAVFQIDYSIYNGEYTQIPMPNTATDLWGDYVSAAWVKRGTYNHYERYIGTVYYYPTYNPYRAVYGIQAAVHDGAPQTLTVDGTSYYAWNEIN